MQHFQIVTKLKITFGVFKLKYENIIDLMQNFLDFLYFLNI